MPPRSRLETAKIRLYFGVPDSVGSLEIERLQLSQTQMEIDGPALKFCDSGDLLDGSRRGRSPEQTPRRNQDLPVNLWQLQHCELTALTDSCRYADISVPNSVDWEGSPTDFAGKNCTLTLHLVVVEKMGGRRSISLSLSANKQSTVFVLLADRIEKSSEVWLRGHYSALLEGIWKNTG